jgi:hypothetical protein
MQKSIKTPINNSKNSSKNRKLRVFNIRNQEKTWKMSPALEKNVVGLVVGKGELLGTPHRSWITSAKVTGPTEVSKLNGLPMGVGPERAMILSSRMSKDLILVSCDATENSKFQAALVVAPSKPVGT